MLSLRLARAAPLKRAFPANAAPATRLPIVQRRSFIPDSISGRNQLDEKYPEDQALSEAEDPNMVRVNTWLAPSWERAED